jgi:hypothetical protein
MWANELLYRAGYLSILGDIQTPVPRMKRFLSLSHLDLVTLRCKPHFDECFQP